MNELKKSIYLIISDFYNEGIDVFENADGEVEPDGSLMIQLNCMFVDRLQNELKLSPYEIKSVMENILLNDISAMLEKNSEIL